MRSKSCGGQRSGGGTQQSCTTIMYSSLVSQLCAEPQRQCVCGVRMVGLRGAAAGEECCLGAHRYFVVV
eukprot:3210-Eustigmatos_ZCMA.PRE.1